MVKSTISTSNDNTDTNSSNNSNNTGFSYNINTQNNNQQQQQDFTDSINRSLDQTKNNINRSTKSQEIKFLNITIL
jgi:hypothetical protein